MDRQDRVTLEKIINHAKDIVEETKIFNSAEEFKDSNDSKMALFDLIQIGELAKSGLSADIVSKLNSIPWEPIYGLRNRIVHGYASVDFSIIYETIKNDVPNLIVEIEKALNTK